MEDNEPIFFRVWGADDVAYGPIELPTLVHWIKEERVLADSWIFVGKPGRWMPAAEVTELKALFHKRRSGVTPAHGDQRITPSSLRRIKMFAGVEDKIVESLLRYMEPVEVKQFSVVVRHGEPADAIYFLLEGEVRAYLVQDGKESTLATLLPGESFGEIALLDSGPRAAFVTANLPSLLLKMPSANFELVLREAPLLALPLSLGLARSLASRLRWINKRYQDSINFSRIAKS